MRACFIGLACLVTLACLTGASALATTADLTPLERRWLKAAWPVVHHAKERAMPLDIVVQPQPTPGLSPLALGFVGGRCKLVLSMRGNPQAQEALDRIARNLGAGDDLLDAALELMAAHEVLGHCRRHLDGRWRSLPVGFDEGPPAGLRDELRQAYLDMRATRREEGYADIVALQWANQRHPGLYERLHAWLLAERSLDLIEGSHHDTLAWIRRADVQRREAATLWRAVLEAEQRTRPE